MTPLKEKLLWDHDHSINSSSKLQVKYHHWISTCNCMCVFFPWLILPHSTVTYGMAQWSRRPVCLTMQTKPCDLSQRKLSDIKSTNTNIYKWKEKTSRVTTLGFSLCTLNSKGWNNMHKTPPPQKILSIFCIKVTMMLHLYSFTCSFYNKATIKFATPTCCSLRRNF